MQPCRDRRDDGDDARVQLLSYDTLADVLRLLAPRDLAVSRSVCKAWRAVVDANRLLCADLLPLTVGGIFIHLHDLYTTQFFSRPSLGPTISGSVDYTRCQATLPAGYIPTIRVNDRCNGLVLANHCVVNPATQQWWRLPPRSYPRMGSEIVSEYLAFDPTVSPHYQVFVIPHAPYKRKRWDVTTEEMPEWPSSPYVIYVFSSQTWRWGKRSFIRKGMPARTISDLKLDPIPDKRRAAYWRGALYILCQTNIVMRISLSDDTYQVIRPPMSFHLNQHQQLYLGKSEKGVYCASLDRYHQLLIWLLQESCGQMEWILKHDKNLEPILRPQKYNRGIQGPWVIQHIKYKQYPSEHGAKKVPVEPKFEWDSDDDSVLEVEDNTHQCNQGYIDFIGFHTFKEVVFLNYNLERLLAYHLNSSKVQDLGNFCPKYYPDDSIQAFVETSFPYTHCWTRELPGKLI